jgi:hypothetical protein
METNDNIRTPVSEPLSARDGIICAPHTGSGLCGEEGTGIPVPI